jgi:hypothetical protein
MALAAETVRDAHGPDGGNFAEAIYAEKLSHQMVNAVKSSRRISPGKT